MIRTLLIIGAVLAWLTLCGMIWALLAAASMDAELAEMTEEIHE